MLSTWHCIKRLVGCVREIKRFHCVKRWGNCFSGTKTITIKHRHGIHLSTGSFREDTTLRTNIFSFAPFPQRAPDSLGSNFFPSQQLWFDCNSPVFSPFSSFVSNPKKTMTFLSSLHRIAPIAATAKRAVKPAFSSAYAVSQQRFNSSSTVEVNNKEKA